MSCDVKCDPVVIAKIIENVSSLDFILKMCRVDPLVLSVFSSVVHLEELWRESRQLQRTAEETGDAAAGG